MRDVAAVLRAAGLRHRVVGGRRPRLRPRHRRTHARDVHERTRRRHDDGNAWPQAPLVDARDGTAFSAECGKCGARRVDQQIGLEETPDQWVERLVAVFREVRRVLRDDGTLWVEIGDSYSGGGYGPSDARPRQARATTTDGACGMRRHHHRPDAGLKPKDLLGQPWLLAFALRADGWYLRSEIIWARPNPMPESVTDRPTKATSTVFLLSKQPRYFYDADAIRERHAEPWAAALERYTEQTARNSGGYSGQQPRPSAAGSATATAHGKRSRARTPAPCGRSPPSQPRSPTSPPGPQALVRRMILAGSPEGGTILDPFTGQAPPTSSHATTDATRSGSN